MTACMHTLAHTLHMQCSMCNWRDGCQWFFLGSNCSWSFGISSKPFAFREEQSTPNSPRGKNFDSSLNAVDGNYILRGSTRPVLPVRTQNVARQRNRTLLDFAACARQIYQSASICEARESPEMPAEDSAHVRHLSDRSGVIPVKRWCKIFISATAISWLRLRCFPYNSHHLRKKTRLPCLRSFGALRPSPGCQALLGFLHLSWARLGSFPLVSVLPLFRVKAFA